MDHPRVSSIVIHCDGESCWLRVRGTDLDGRSQDIELREGNAAPDWCLTERTPGGWSLAPRNLWAVVLLALGPARGMTVDDITDAYLRAPKDAVGREIDGPRKNVQTSVRAMLNSHPLLEPPPERLAGRRAKEIRPRTLCVLVDWADGARERAQAWMAERGMVFARVGPLTRVSYGKAEPDAHPADVPAAESRHRVAEPTAKGSPAQALATRRQVVSTTLRSLGTRRGSGRLGGRRGAVASAAILIALAGLGVYALRAIMRTPPSGHLLVLHARGSQAAKAKLYLHEVCRTVAKEDEFRRKFPIVLLVSDDDRAAFENLQESAGAWSVVSSDRKKGVAGYDLLSQVQDIPRRFLLSQLCAGDLTAQDSLLGTTFLSAEMLERDNAEFFLRLARVDANGSVIQPLPLIPLALGGSDVLRQIVRRGLGLSTMHRVMWWDTSPQDDGPPIVTVSTPQSQELPTEITTGRRLYFWTMAVDGPTHTADEIGAREAKCSASCPSANGPCDSIVARPSFTPWPELEMQSQDRIESPVERQVRLQRWSVVFPFSGAYAITCRFGSERLQWSGRVVDLGGFVLDRDGRFAVEELHATRSGNRLRPEQENESELLAILLKESTLLSARGFGTTYRGLLVELIPFRGVFPAVGGGFPDAQNQTAVPP